MSNPCFYVLDVECLGAESTSVCLSLAMTYVDMNSLDENPNKAYQQLLDSTLFIKFDVKDQFNKKRITTRDTMDWWKKQGEYVRQISYIPSNNDTSIEDGLKKINEFYKKDIPIYTRGPLDSLILDSLCRMYNITCKIHFTAIRDVRTFISLVYPLSKGGYVDIDNFDKDKVIKHHPSHDCAYDALMMLRGEVEPF